MMSLNVLHRVVPMRLIKHVRAPFSLAPNRAEVVGGPMNSLGRLIGDPTHGMVDIAPGIWDQQVHVRGLDHHRDD